MSLVVAIIFAYIINIADHAPVQEGSSFNFDDGWNYKLAAHKSPLLNGSTRHFLKPRYTYGKELQVAGLGVDNEEPSVGAQQQLRSFGADTKEVLGLEVTCPVCQTAVQFLQRQLNQGKTFETIKQYFMLVCASYTNIDVCSGLFDSYGPELMPVLTIISDASDICKMILGENCENSDVPAQEWKLELPALSRSHVSEPNLPKPDSPIFKVLHISDTHYDPDYVEGSVSNCQEPLCCRPSSTPNLDEQPIPAGKWGAYAKCDAPQELLENMLNHIALQHPDIDYIIWTGDLPPHDIWNQTKKSNLEVIQDTVDMVFRLFPDKPVFPAIGNHESAPAGNFPPPWVKDDGHSISWLYKEVAKQWLRWLPASTGTTLYHGAFYSVLLRPGFRLISLNTNYCYSLSWWLYVNGTDPASELKWLVNELRQAEINNEHVHIIGHVAPGSDDCLKIWSRNFYEIVSRFQSTIKGLFYGHSHADEFQMFYDPKNFSRSTAVAYLAPSVTSFRNYNPAYRIYYVDGDHKETTREILDHETWTFDLDSANVLNNRPRWFKLYSAREAYEMESLRPKEWNKLIRAMEQKETMFNRFYRNYYRESPTAPLCDGDCKSKILCNLKCAKSQSKKELCNLDI